MQIDFDSLSFKIEKPEASQCKQLLRSEHSFPKFSRCFGFEDTQTTNQQQTLNPFRRTFHLFKHVEIEKMTSRQKSLQPDKSLSLHCLPEIANITQTTYSLQNFDSFKNFDSKIDKTQFKQSHGKSAIRQSNQSQFIKIQSQLQQSDELSLIIDDLNSQLKDDDLIWDNHRRTKTEIQKCELEFKQREAKAKKSEGTFFLTAQDQSSESTVKEFYFNLKEEQEKLANKQSQKKQPLKDELKRLMYQFIDDIQTMEENLIDVNFLQRVQQCFLTVKKMPALRNSNPICLEKWENERKDHSKNEGRQFKKSQLSQPRKNKENSMQTKNIAKQCQVSMLLDSKQSKYSKRKNWV